MNLSQVLNVALPDLPPQQFKEALPRIHPRVIAREHLESKGPTVYAMNPEGKAYFRFSPLQWSVVQLFDGERSYAEIARVAKTKLGVAWGAETMRQLGDSLERGGFWYKTPQEESMVLCHQLAQSRHKRLTRKGDKRGDLSTIHIAEFDPDKFLTWTHSKLKWVYSTWFTAITLVMFAAMGVIFVAGWSEIWRDSVDYYKFLTKGWSDIGEFYLLFAVLAVLHETAHGITCKHFGGESHRMGAFLIYLTPGVFCDVTQVWIYGGLWQRVATMVAGTWAELILCAVMTFVWWGTAAGGAMHEIAYKFMLIGGVFVVIINMNPLAKLDGYYIMSEMLRIPDLKGSATAFASNWMKKNVFRMPVTVPFVPPKRRPAYFAYAVISGVYSYLLLFFVVKILYRVGHHFTPTWAFIPSAALALFIFRSRIKRFLKFLEDLYLDKRDFMRLHRNWLIAGSAVLLVALGAPLRHESVQSRFILEPVSRAALRAEVPGTVVAVMADEGQRVTAGETIAQLSDLRLESEVANTSAQYQIAVARNNQSKIQYAGYGPAEQQQQQLAEANRLLGSRAEHLRIVSPISGVVVSPHVRDLVGSYVSEGTPIVEIADVSALRARIFVPEPEIAKLGHVSGIRLRVESFMAPLKAQLVSVTPKPHELEPGLFAEAKYKDVRPVVYYEAIALVPNPDGRLRDGMTGSAKISGRRRSVIGMALQPVADFIGRKVW